MMEHPIVKTYEAQIRKEAMEAARRDAKERFIFLSWHGYLVGIISMGVCSIFQPRLIAISLFLGVLWGVDTFLERKSKTSVKSSVDSTENLVVNVGEENQ